MLRLTHRLSPRAGALALLAASGVWLSACGDMRQAIGIDKSVPDEFAVVTKAPLVMPPDYTLRPPQPGAAGAAEVDPTAAARDALVTGAGGTPATATTPVESAPAPAPVSAPVSAPAPGSAAAPAPAPEANSAGQTALLNAAGADRADPNIRENVNGEAQKSEDFTNQLLYGTPTGTATPAAASAPAGAPANSGAQGVPASASAPQPAPTDTAQKPEEEEEDEGWLDWF